MTPPPDPRHLDDRGSALVVVIMAMVLMASLGSALVLIAVTETRLSFHQARAGILLYAADGAIEHTVADLAALEDWDQALAGLATSTLTDGPPGGARAISGTTIDLTALTSELRCGRAVGCLDADVLAFTSERPWGPDNPRWQLFAWGPFSARAPQMAGATDAYLVVWVGDDPGDTDGDPLRDGTEDNPGRGTIALVAHAYGAGGTRRIVEATIARTPPGVPLRTRVVSWREVR
jgi:hypothetical protein